MIRPDSMAENLGGKAMTVVRETYESQTALVPEARFRWHGGRQHHQTIDRTGM
jgi:hypothetical protein